MKNRYIIFFLIIIVSCQPVKQGERSLQDTTNIKTDSDANLLTDSQKKEGWVLLFDGTTLNGWRTFKNVDDGFWEVSNGTLHRRPSNDNEGNKSIDLITINQYGNFILSFEWKICPKGNSGVMFRVTEDFDQPYASGPEYQIIDDEGYPDKLNYVQLTAANYDMQVAENKIVNPPLTWNESKIIADGNRVEHWLNGSPVLEYEINSPEWNAQKEQSKWKDFPGYAKALKGHIDLQDHGNEVWFRNIMIKPL